MTWFCIASDMSVSRTTAFPSNILDPFFLWFFFYFLEKSMTLQNILISTHKITENSEKKSYQLFGKKYGINLSGGGFESELWYFCALQSKSKYLFFSFLFFWPFNELKFVRIRTCSNQRQLYKKQPCLEGKIYLRVRLP